MRSCDEGGHNAHYILAHTKAHALHEKRTHYTQVHTSAHTSPMTTSRLRAQSIRTRTHPERHAGAGHEYEMRHPCHAHATPT